ncbi:unnamed protein product, partial [Owenia fusiformis]
MVVTYLPFGLVIVFTCLLLSEVEGRKTKPTVGFPGEAAQCRTINYLLYELYGPIWGAPLYYSYNHYMGHRYTSLKFIVEDIGIILNDTSIDANERFMLHNMMDTIENVLLGSAKRHEESYNKVRDRCETSVRVCDLTRIVWPSGLKDKQLKQAVRNVARVVHPGVSVWDAQIVKENGQKKFEKKMLYAYEIFERVWNHSMKRAVRRDKSETINQLNIVFGICSSFKDNVLKTIQLYIEYDDAVMHTIKVALNYMNAYGSLHKCKHCNILDVYCMNDFCPPVTRGLGCDNTLTDTRECLIEHKDSV